jgi:hypothetical protein
MLSLDLFRSFIAVKNIFLSNQFTRRIALATDVQKLVGVKNDRKFARPGHH